MSEEHTLTADQEKRIVATLKRIRGGFRRTQTNQFEEPAHIFVPEAFNDQNK